MRKVMLLIGSVCLFVALWQGLNFGLENLLDDKGFRVFLSGLISGVVAYIATAFVFWDQANFK